MSDTEIMDKSLREKGRGILADILIGFGDRVERISLSTRSGNVEIRQDIELALPSPSDQEEGAA
ncbi:hypothetical protein [Pseudodonghicola flavimaris]|uniref:DUF2292 domain-containing protein n=1 Tax=Pseudodonghicola flavimaris TaxID=3050036 RepID=A0ABT7EW02_9RHOB|nr:hypothetical protein [Pseudodonghicola flavimaris]MDK3016524.1 hypothetical protein [Pseudodonghicola flavimaris]